MLVGKLCVTRFRARLARGEEDRGSPGPQPPASNMREMVSSMFSLVRTSLFTVIRSGMMS